MIFVSVILVSARTGETTELARMALCNEGGTEQVGHYRAETYHGRSTEKLNRRQVQRSAKVLGHRRQALHVWHLVQKALTAMGYGER
ncbi:MAG TPA: hypothetical protein VFF89_08590 [Sphingobium sp.]|nr:hypothetical protein [Sphingobium sp.]